MLPSRSIMPDKFPELSPLHAQEHPVDVSTSKKLISNL